MIRLSLILLLPFLVQYVAGQEEDFQCGVYEAAQTLDVTQDFDTIAPEVTCENNPSLLVPSTVHWHVYAIPDGEMARYSMFPEDLVEPFVQGGTLKWAWTKGGLQGVNKGDKIQAAVNLYIPASKMKSINVDSVDQVVEIINIDSSSAPESITIRDSGVNNNLYVSSPVSKVQYTGSGVNSILYLEAASGSSVELSGVDQNIRVKTVDDLSVKMTGVDQEVTIDAGDNGDNIKIVMSGVDNTALVNGNAGCSDVSKSGVKNNCNLSDETVTVPELECLAVTTVSKWQCGCSWKFSDTAAAVAGVVVAVVIVSIFACVFLCYWRRRNNSKEREHQPVQECARKVVPFGVEEQEAAPDAITKDALFELEGVSDDTPTVEVQVTEYAGKDDAPLGGAEAPADNIKEVPFGAATTSIAREEIPFAHACPVEAKVY